jgi:hypothetical protein
MAAFVNNSIASNGPYADTTDIHREVEEPNIYKDLYTKLNPQDFYGWREVNSEPPPITVKDYEGFYLTDLLIKINYNPGYAFHIRWLLINLSLEKLLNLMYDQPIFRVSANIGGNYLVDLNIRLVHRKFRFAIGKINNTPLGEYCTKIINKVRVKFNYKPIPPYKDRVEEELPF